MDNEYTLHNYFYRYGYMYAKNYQIWWRFDEVLTKTSWVIFGTFCILFEASLCVVLTKFEVQSQL